MKVLVLGRTQQVMDRILPLVREEGFDAVGVLTDEEAVENLSSGEFDLVAIGGGVEINSRALIHQVASEVNTLAIDIFGPDTLLPRLRALSNNK